MPTPYSMYVYILLIITTSSLYSMEEEGKELKSNINKVISAVTVYNQEGDTITETQREDYTLPYTYFIPTHAGGFSLPTTYNGTVKVTNLKKNYIGFLYCLMKNNKQQLLSVIHSDTVESFSQIFTHIFDEKIKRQEAISYIMLKITCPHNTIENSIDRIGQEKFKGISQWYIQPLVLNQRPLTFFIDRDNPLNTSCASKRIKPEHSCPTPENNSSTCIVS